VSSGATIELENGRIGTMDDPDVAARVEFDAAHLAKFHSRGKLRPGGERLIRIDGCG